VNAPHLTKEEQSNVRTALKFLRLRCGTFGDRRECRPIRGEHALGSRDGPEGA
jgi:hypothetical protein